MASAFDDIEVLVEFLKQTLKDSKNEKVRMQAAERLQELYRQHLFYTERAEARKERAELRALGLPLPKAIGRPSKGEAPTPEPTAEELQRNLERAEIDKALGRTA